MIMKNLLILLGILVSALAYANKNYEKAMKKSLAQMDAATSMDDFQIAANTFGRIAEMEPEGWLPAYYAAYAQTVVAANTEDPETKDSYLDQAQSYIDSMANIDKDESEVLSLQAFVYMIRISVDPGARGQAFSQKSAKELQKAKALNPDNPRTLFMLAQLTYGTAQFFGSDTSEACDMNEKALQLFDTPSETEDELAPRWGKRQALGFRENCKN
jgi:tetratricopeptide (TPR) repeat protein